MKKLIIVLFLLLNYIGGIAQVEWDTEEYSAGDYSKKWYWHLPHDEFHNWKKQDGLEAHTVFRAYQSQTGMVAFLNLNTFHSNSTHTIFDLYYKMGPIFEKQDENMRNRGIVVSDRDYKPYSLNGTDAIRVYYKQKKKNGKTGKYDIENCLTYYLLNELGLYIVAVKCPQASFVKYGIAYMEGVARGFILMELEQ